MAKYMAVYVGAPNLGGRPDIDDKTIAAGMAAWQGWAERYAGQTLDGGGPLGKTKRVSREGVSDVNNTMTGYVIIQADTHEAAAQMFLNHPHFSIFPGDAVEIMPCMPIPTV